MRELRGGELHFRGYHRAPVTFQHQVSPAQARGACSAGLS
jgi:hypothetical protein